MSLPEFSAVLDPDPRLRSVVLLSGAIAAVAGAVIIMALPIALFARAGLVLAWLAWSGWQLVGLVRGYRFCRRFCVFPDGGLQIVAADGRALPGRVGPGSVVLGHVAWLRIEAASGGRWAEPVAGNRRESAAWRRFQVIWRHLGSAV